MTREDAMALLPQPVRTERLEQLPGGLERIFEGSLPKSPGLTPLQACVAERMRNEGSDPVTIARWFGASPNAVADHFRRIDEAAARAAAERTQEVARAAPPAPVQSAQPRKPKVAAKSPGAEPARPKCAPDVELTALQESVLRGLLKLHVPCRVIANGMRLPIDQVQRVAGEAP